MTVLLSGESPNHFMITQPPLSKFSTQLLIKKHSRPPTWFELDLHPSVTLDLFDHLPVSANDDADRVSRDGNLWYCNVDFIQLIQ